MYGKTERTFGHKTRKYTQLKFYKAMTEPCLMYGSETCTLLEQRTEDNWKQQRRDFCGM
jgi:hypothetical protein